MSAPAGTRPGPHDNACFRWSIEPQGDRTLLIIHPSNGSPSVEVGRKCASLAAALNAAAIAGIVDIVPAFDSVALHYRPLFGVSVESLAAQVRHVLAATRQADTIADGGRTIDIPVCYGGDHGPDLISVAEHCGLSPSQVVDLHSAEPAYVFMLGFAPGAPYLGVHDSRLDIARRRTPRLALPAGSVATANRQTIVYPNASPGGWHVIGATPISLFSPERTPPSLLQAGDMVRFVPIDPWEFSELQAREP